MPRALPSLAPKQAAGVNELHAMLRGFADPVRIRVLNLLVAGELCVCDLTGILRLPQSSVSRHLAYLRRVRLVETTREGKFAHYRFSEPRNKVHRGLLSWARTSFAGIPALERERAKAVERVLRRALDPC